jgi:hypothetical protein
MQACTTEAVNQKAEVANPDKTLGKHVQKEPSQELRGCQSHLALLAAVRVVFPAERDACPIKCQ